MNPNEKPNPWDAGGDDSISPLLRKALDDMRRNLIPSGVSAMFGSISTKKCEIPEEEVAKTIKDCESFANYGGVEWR